MTMGRSLFRKLLVSYLSVLLVGLGLLAVLINVTLQHFLFQQKEAALYRQADEVIARLQSKEDGPASSSFEKIDAEYRRTTNTKMDLLLPEDGSSLLQKNTKAAAKRLLRKSELKDPALLEQVFSGQRIHATGPFKKTDDQVLLSVGVPMMEDGRVVGALFLHMPVQEFQLKELTRLVLLVAIIIAFPAALVLYWISRKISQPLVRMNQAAARIGLGDFSERIPVSGRDEIGQLSATFNRMAGQLEALEAMRKELISNVSHELRTPLTSVRGFIQAILEGMVPAEQQRKYLDYAYQELYRLTGLLNTMLDLSAIESGRMSLQMIKIRWSSLVETVGDGFQLRMQEKGIAFRILEPEQDQARLTVQGDPERLKQVLFNLLDNALRHTPEGGRIEVQSRPAGDTVEVSVTDTGAGIPPAELPYIWERFYTGEASRLSRRERSGLGLTITKQLVERMGGSIEVTSEPGSGTTFTLRLPSG
ncbi:sensor histidine kinase [Paenibacillus rigui]|uniref:histidine kinase n=1 Tax=Paenibacillus rigui TaxID=554312 RepID=A0A229UP84_9BACL|nr:HAMP domain-containing sensor histidine kinase [Paenibacillus rigui]OXM85174.1 hypothetical protein CF651_16355 [Paenibacillus rigui]